MNSSHLIIKNSTLASLQDQGRYGYEKFGITINGASDMYSYMLGNKLLGNSLADPSIEVTLFDFSIQSFIDIPFCVTGCPADVMIDEKIINQWSVQILPAGSTLTIKNIKKGLKNYIAFLGGINAEKVLGSVSPDSIANIGETLKTGDALSLKKTQSTFETINSSSNHSIHIPSFGSPWNIRVTDGPDTNEFKHKLETFFSSQYTVSPMSNQVGIRLDGPSLSNSSLKELLSRGVAIGAIQVIPSGQPIVLHRGRTLTAGYPVVGTVSSYDLSLIGQARPGDKVNFSYISIHESENLYRETFGMLN